MVAVQNADVHQSKTFPDGVTGNTGGSEPLFQRLNQMRDTPLVRWLRVEPFVVKPPVTDVEIEHQPGVWVRARVDRLWWFHGAWMVAVYYY